MVSYCIGVAFSSTEAVKFAKVGTVLKVITPIFASMLKLAESPTLML